MDEYKDVPDAIKQYIIKNLDKTRYDIQGNNQFYQNLVENVLPSLNRIPSYSLTEAQKQYLSETPEVWDYVKKYLQDLNFSQQEYVKRLRQQSMKYNPFSWEYKPDIIKL